MTIQTPLPTDVIVGNAVIVGKEVVVGEGVTIEKTNIFV
jgi:acetyltransferase-like isoleucine patch superfamily enzyme